LPINYGINETSETNALLRNITNPAVPNQIIETYPQVCVTELRDSYTYCRDYLLISNFILMAFIPFSLLLILNSLTFRSIRISTMNNSRTTKRQRRDHGIARMFTLIVLIFFVCNTPRMILNIWEVNQTVFFIDFVLFRSFPCHYFFWKYGSSNYQYTAWFCQYVLLKAKALMYKTASKYY
jgi:hypothetical protein